MKNEDVVNLLVPLMHTDVDAWRAYGQAIDNCDDDEVRRQLESFRGDHERHIDELSRLVSRYGGTPPARTPDPKGFFIEGFTAIRSMTGTQGALAAMRRNEQLTNGQYRAACQRQDLPDDVRSLLQRNLDDEKRHLAWIQARLGMPQPV